MGKVSAKLRGSLQPRTNVIVTCRGKNGENNAIAIAYCCNCSNEPPMVMVGIVPSRHSHHMIKQTGCFVINLVGRDNVEMFNYFGAHSGRDEDKIKAVGAKISDGMMVNAPILDACPVNIECTVVDSIVTGTHEMFVGKVEYVHAEEAVLNKDNMVDFSRTLGTMLK